MYSASWVRNKFAKLSHDWVQYVTRLLGDNTTKLLKF